MHNLFALNMQTRALSITPKLSLEFGFRNGMFERTALIHCGVHGFVYSPPVVASATR